MQVDNFDCWTTVGCENDPDPVKDVERESGHTRLEEPNPSAKFRGDFAYVGPPGQGCERNPPCTTLLGNNDTHHPTCHLPT